MSKFDEYKEKHKNCDVSSKQRFKDFQNGECSKCGEYLGV